MSAGVRRMLAWTVGGCSLAVIVVLLVLVVLDLGTADSTASVVSAVVAVVGLGLSGITLLVTPSSGTTASTITVRARGRRALGVAGDMRGNALGDRSRVTGPPTPSASSVQPPAAPVHRDVSARGEGAAAVGGDALDNAVGEDSDR